MSIELIVACVAITCALVLYTFGVFGERRSGTLSLRHVLLFWGGLVVALERDPNVAHDRLLGALAPEPLCAFVWGSMLSSIKRGDPRCETLFALLRRTLYEPPFA